MVEKIKANIREQISPYLDRPDFGLEKTVEKNTGYSETRVEQGLSRKENNDYQVGTYQQLQAYHSQNTSGAVDINVIHKEIEAVLEEDLADIYFTLSPTDQMRFKVEGERASSEIAVMLADVKCKVQKIVDVIKRWLSFLPGVNKFFIEQEAKIKADKLMAKFR